ncbi:penicillin-binding protein 1C [Suttonella sp. R2A3]|uniref:penicillin-binding protein 1C n=1 Tax=Suttonella sp. R2A3 TaxID=2908648 RepID=UPI001F290990|nr:penicillin-binding protein 1C [Suttonella sp. R2A3]UJF24971.1 penicillin-binding protein 1C [Suttonella sp. R2A3]
MKTVKWLVITAILLVALAWLLDRLFPPDLSRYQDCSSVVVDREGKVLNIALSQDEQWRLSVAQLSPHYLKLLIAYEDQSFFAHIGVDPLAIARATWQNISNMRVISGASTLTMQTARLLEPRPRTLANKAIEALRALQLEWHYDKKTILEMYATLAPMGGNVQGVETASWYYFAKPARDLTLSEAAWLVALPQSPKRYSDPIYAQEARDKVLQRALTQDVIAREEIERALAEPIIIKARPMPRHAPHISAYLRNRQPEQCVIGSTLDANLQTALETLLAQTLRSRDAKSNMAGAVLDNSSGEYLAYVGSADFFSLKRDGQIDMLRAVRSPGSTLKPFITLFAFDWLNYHPSSHINDTPITRGSYRPVNYDGRFSGEITLADALARSRNVPAVRLLAAIDPDYFAAALRRRGLSLFFPGNKQANLAIALGGVGVRADELIHLYRDLANCTFNPRQELAEQRACINVTRILYQVSDLRYGDEPVALKTGTSYGWRDGWLIGYTRDVTLLLWEGRADGSAGEQRSGGEALLSPMRQLVALLPKEKTPYTALPPLERYITQTRRAVQPSTTVKQNVLHIVSPLSNSQIDWRENSPISLVVKGGQAPYLWFINDEVVAQTATPRAQFQPQTGGTYYLSVIDQQGESASARFSLDNAPTAATPTITLQRSEVTENSP